MNKDMKHKDSTDTNLSEKNDYIIDESKVVIDHQIKEIRNQKNKALRILRGQFAVAGILLAAVTTISTQSVPFSIPIEVTGLGTPIPLILFIGIFLLLRGVIGFFRGIYRALNVLSSSKVRSIPYLHVIIAIFQIGRGKSPSFFDQQMPCLGPSTEDFRAFQNPGSDQEQADIAKNYLECVEHNDDIIKANEELLLSLYRKMAWGTTVFAAGIIISIIGTIVVS